VVRFEPQCPLPCCCVAVATPPSRIRVRRSRRLRARSGRRATRGRRGCYSAGAPNQSVAAADASSLSSPDDGAADAGAGFGLRVGSPRPGDTSPAAVPPPFDGALADGELHDAEGAAEDGATIDGGDAGGTPCDRLIRCCQNLIAPPPALLACVAGVQQADGGNAGSCESLLAGFQGSGLCVAGRRATCWP